MKLEANIGIRGCIHKWVMKIQQKKHLIRLLSEFIFLTQYSLLIIHLLKAINQIIELEIVNIVFKKSIIQLKKIVKITHKETVTFT